METLLQDLKFGIKLLAKNYGFSITAIITLTLCIAANTTIFSVVNSVLIRPLPIPESDRIVLMYNSYPKAGAERASNGVPDYYDRLRDLGDLFEEQAFYNYTGLTIGEQDRPERLMGMAVTPSFLRLLRVEPLLGRNFNEEEGEQGNEQKTILSYSSWQEIYGGDETILGRDLRINGNPYTIIGVLPKNFLYLNPDVKLWIPLAFSPQQKSDEARHNNSWDNIGRLRKGATLKQVQSKLDALTAATLDRFPEFKQILLNAGYHVQAHFLKDEVVSEVKGTLYLLWAGVLFVLLIGCVNITNLVLVRTSVRIKELTTRFAIGASRWRVARQLLTESVLMTVVGGAFGLLLGFFGLKLLNSLGLSELPRGSEIAMDSQVILVIMAITLVVGLMIGILPVAQVLRWNTNIVFREGARTGTSSRGVRAVRKGLVVAQISIALVLLVGAALLLESFTRVIGIDPGFREPETVLTGSVNLPQLRYSEDSDIRSFMNRLLERVRSQPGVIEVGCTSTLPFGGNYSDSVILAEGYVMEPGESVVSPSRIVVTPGYFEAMGIPLKQGRFFDERDVEDSQQTIIVDERLARKFWPEMDPLGRRMFSPNNPGDLLAIDENTSFFTVVGVVGSVKLRRMVDTDEPVGAYYFPFQQSPRRGMGLAVRTAVKPNSLTEIIRKELAAVDPEIPFFGVQTMQDRLDEALLFHRSPMVLAVAFGLLALFLATVGIYGVLAYLVTERTKEIGIRMALGCGPSELFKQIQLEGLFILVIGLVFGLGGAIVLSRFIESLLFGVNPLDPFVISISFLVLSISVVIACAIPAFRATRINPVRALSIE